MKAQAMRVLRSAALLPICALLSMAALAQDGQKGIQSQDRPKTTIVDPFSGVTHLTSPRLPVLPPAVSPPALRPPTSAAPHTAPSQMPVVSPSRGWSPPAATRPAELVTTNVTEGPASWTSQRVAVPQSYRESVSPTVVRSEWPTASEQSVAWTRLYPQLDQLTSLSTSTLTYSIELRDQWGGVTPVSAARTFRTGEQIRFRFRSPIDGRIAIVQREPDGASTVLYPYPTFAGSDWVRGDIDTIIPAEGAWFIFDRLWGDSTLFVTVTGYGLEIPSLREPVSPGAASLLGSRVEPGGKSLRLVLESAPVGRTPAYGSQPFALAPTLRLQISLHQQQ